VTLRCTLDEQHDHREEMELGPDLQCHLLIPFINRHL
jgi:hypothetical protein